MVYKICNMNKMLTAWRPWTFIEIDHVTVLSNEIEARASPFCASCLYAINLIEPQNLQKVKKMSDFPEFLVLCPVYTQ